jgi:general secretion pathway protein F
VDNEAISGYIESREGYVVNIRTIPNSRRRRLKKPKWPALLSALDALELMLANGVRINTALRNLATVAQKGPIRRLLSDVCREVEDNGSFAAALSGWPQVFDRAMTGIIAAHEASGQLRAGILEVRRYAGNMYEIRQSTIRAIWYPMVIIIAGLIASGVIFGYTLPRFMTMIAEIGDTRINRLSSALFGLSKLVTNHPALSLFGLIFPVALICALHRTRWGRWMESVLAQLPAFGAVVEAFAMARICATFKALNSSGVHVLDALRACVTVAGSRRFSDGLQRAIAAIENSEPVGIGFEKAKVFAPEMVMAIKAGEGALGEVFARLQEFYIREAKHRTEIALRMLETSMLVVVLGWVLAIVLAVTLPMVDIINAIH